MKELFSGMFRVFQQGAKSWRRLVDGWVTRFFVIRVVRE
jgi:hypothetical protein